MFHKYETVLDLEYWVKYWCLRVSTSLTPYVLRLRKSLHIFNFGTKSTHWYIFYTSYDIWYKVYTVVQLLQVRRRTPAAKTIAGLTSLLSNLDLQCPQLRVGLTSL